MRQIFFFFLLVVVAAIVAYILINRETGFEQRGKLTIEQIIEDDLVAEDNKKADQAVMSAYANFNKAWGFKN